MIAKFKPGSHIPATINAQSAYDRISALRARGLSKPIDIVEDARPEGSLLHEAFTWDDTEAARKHRIDEARHLCNSIVVIYDDEPARPSGPAFISVTVRETQERGYIPTAEAVTDEDYRSQMLTEALEGYLALGRRFRNLKELARIRRAVDETVALIATRDGKVAS